MSNSMSLYRIRMEGWQALTERLGPAGAMRFMMQYDPGHGDYTKERRELFADMTIDDVLDALNERDRPEKAAVEKAEFVEALVETKGNTLKAASRPGISRQALHGKPKRRKPTK